MACNIQLIQVNSIDPDAGPTGFLIHNGELVLEIHDGQISSYLVERATIVDAGDLGVDRDEDWDWDWNGVKKFLCKQGMWEEKIGVVGPTKRRSDSRKRIDVPAGGSRFENALEACRALVSAYKGGERSGSIDWSDLDYAHDLALKVVRNEEE